MHPDAPTPDRPPRHGRLIVFSGPMFAGKTSALMSRLRDAQSQGHQVHAVKPLLDSRYHPTALASHDGRQWPARAVTGPEDLHRAAASFPAGALLAIDEAHFFGPGLEPVVLALLRAGVTLLVAGLERDHRGRPFEPFPFLLCEADEVHKLTGVCARCGGQAVHTTRLVESDARILVGGTGAYEARCRACFSRS